MRCEKCGTENAGDSEYCKNCGESLKKREEVTGPAPSLEEGEVEEAAVSEEEPTTFARFLSIAWDRKGPILMALFLVLMMAMVLAPWVFLKINALGIQIVSNSYSGWSIYIPRVLFYLSIIPLLVALMMVAGIGTRRQVVETHICAFFGGVIFTVWVTIFSLSKVISSVVPDLKVLHLEVIVSGVQIVTIFLFVGFIFGIVVTSYDRGRRLEEAGIGG